MRPENAVIELALPARSPRRAARLFHRLDVMDYQYKKPTRIQVLSNFSKLRNSYKIEGYEQTQKERKRLLQLSWPIQMISIPERNMGARK